MRALGVLLIAVAGVFVFEGCGSDGGSSTSGGQKVQDAGSSSNSCNLGFCPSVGMGKACCAGSQCGLDYGFGCTATRHLDAGQ